MDRTVRQSQGGRQDGKGAPNDVRLTRLGSIRKDDREGGQIGNHLSRHTRDVLADLMQRDTKD